MKRNGQPLLNAVLTYTGTWGDRKSSQVQSPPTPAGSWRSGSSQTRVASSEEKKPIRQPQVNTGDESQQIGVHRDAVSSHDHTRETSLVKYEPKNEETSMENGPVDNPQSVAMVPVLEHGIPLYRPHLGSRQEYEKQYGLAPGESYKIGKSDDGKSQATIVRQESSPLREITNESQKTHSQEQVAEPLAPEKVARITWVLQKDLPLHPPSKFYVAYIIKKEESGIKDETTWDTCIANNWGNQTPSHTHVTSGIKEGGFIKKEEGGITDEDTWDAYNDWSNGQPSHTHVTSGIKEGGFIKKEDLYSEDEGTASPELAFILSRQDTPASPLVPPTASGLSTLRYASDIQQRSTFQPTKNDTEVARKPNTNVQHKFGSGQALADPMEFMSAVSHVPESKGQSTRVKPPTQRPVERTRLASRATETPLVEPISNNKKTHNGTVVVSGTTERYEDRFQSNTTNWPKFPSTTHGQDISPTVEPWAAESPRNVDSTPTKRSAANTTLANQAEAASGWQKHATAERKKNKTPIEQVKFVPVGWSPSPSPPKAKSATTKASASKVPSLIEASKYPHYPDNATTKQGAATLAVTPNFQVQLPLGNVDAQTMIDTLTRQLQEQGDRLATAEQGLATYRQDREEVNQELSALNAEVEDAKEIRKQYTKLKAEYEALKTTLSSPPTAGSAPPAGQIEWVMQRNHELERENRNKEPLFKIGRDVRARFLEEARFTVLQIERSELDKSILERGHIASRNAVGDADAALLTGGFLTNAQVKNLGPIFHTLYASFPGEYYDVGAKMRNAMEAYATCQTSPALNSIHAKLPREELEEIESLVRMLAEKHSLMGAGEFEVDGGGHAAGYLKRIKELMVPVTLFERKWCRQAVKEKLGKCCCVDCFEG